MVRNVIIKDKTSINKTAYHPLCHLEIHKKDGLKVLHHLGSILLGNKNRLFTIDDLKSVQEAISCLFETLPYYNKSANDICSIPEVLSSASR